ncbi:MAG: cardiolipin synthase, partial [Mucilaginibacter sp.]|nr:cardiolipin synthase [Mucilaginibacter sp.]
MSWYVLVVSIYWILVTLVCFRILYDIRSTSKTFAYLLITILVPVVGMLIYFAVGANYRKNKLYS